MMDEKFEIEQERQRDMADEAKQAAKEICKERGRHELIGTTMLGGFKFYDNWTGKTYYEYD